MLDAETATLRPLDVRTRYVLVAEAGLRQAHGNDRVSLPGEQWQALQQALGHDALFSDTLRACIPGLRELKIQLSALLHYHCGVKVLKTRQLMMDLQAL
jgi:DNA repair protein RecO (recombination protein O)